ncbi:GDSL family lipase [Leptolyngbya sp. NIES-2104]|uniref:GDSL family lipase n=1 Tax=Leptolyngbya sp. NIES-2104 TaxID=1552121 RepID=UPI00092ECF20|nr:GDSL family lipase [Leptolyngbya sp. NIES-2104]
MFFRSSRKSSWSSRSLYQKKKALPKRWIFLSIPLVLLGLELFARLAVGAAGKTAELDAFRGEPLNITAYRLKFLDQQGRPFAGLPDHGQLTVKRSPMLGYRLMGNQQNPAWKINEQGFRADQAVSLDKPRDEVRIFLLGGSAAFGQLSSNNQSTIAAQLETRLNQQVAAQKSAPNKFRPDTLPYFADELEKALKLPPRIRETRYRVINAAVPGYASGNELAQLAFEVLPYKPDAIVLMNGYSDLLLPSANEGVDVPEVESLMASAPRHLIASWGNHLDNFFHQFYLVKSVQYWVFRPQTALKQLIPPTEAPVQDRLTTDTKELDQRTTRYRQNLQQVSRLVSASKIPLFIALQPEVSSRAAKPAGREKEILDQLGARYPEQIKTGYTKLQSAIEQVKRETPNTATLNLTETVNTAQGEVFQDAIHLTDSANSAIANRLYDAIVPRLHVQPKPYTGGNVPPS